MQEDHPILATVAFLVSLVFGSPYQGQNAMTGLPPAPLPDLITCNPDPPKRGQDVSICFNFRPGDPSPVTLRVEFSTPAGTKSQTIQASNEAPCDLVAVPSDATDMLVVDESGTSGPLARVIPA